MSGYRSEIPSEVVKQTQRIQKERHTKRECWHCGGSKIDPDGGEDLVECCVCRGKGALSVAEQEEDA